MDGRAKLSRCETKAVPASTTPAWNETHELDVWCVGGALEFTLLSLAANRARGEAKAVIASDYFYPSGFQGTVPLVTLADLDGDVAAALYVQILPSVSAVVASPPRWQAQAPAQVAAIGHWDFEQQDDLAKLQSGSLQRQMQSLRRAFNDAEIVHDYLLADNEMLRHTLQHEREERKGLVVDRITRSIAERISELQLAASSTSGHYPESTERQQEALRELSRLEVEISNLKKRLQVERAETVRRQATARDTVAAVDASSKIKRLEDDMLVAQLARDMAQNAVTRSLGAFHAGVLWVVVSSPTASLSSRQCMLRELRGLADRFTNLLLALDLPESSILKEVDSAVFEGLTARITAWSRLGFREYCTAGDEVRMCLYATSWFSLYEDFVKSSLKALGQIIVQRRPHGLDLAIAVLCIEGGAISRCEARQMPRMVDEVKRELRYMTGHGLEMDVVQVGSDDPLQDVEGMLQSGKYQRSKHTDEEIRKLRAEVASALRIKRERSKVSLQGRPSGADIPVVQDLLQASRLAGEGYLADAGQLAEEALWRGVGKSLRSASKSSGQLSPQAANEVVAAGWLEEPDEASVWSRRWYVLRRGGLLRSCNGPSAAAGALRADGGSSCCGGVSAPAVAAMSVACQLRPTSRALSFIDLKVAYDRPFILVLELDAAGRQERRVFDTGSQRALEGWLNSMRSEIARLKEEATYRLGQSSEGSIGWKAIHRME